MLKNHAHKNVLFAHLLFVEKMSRWDMSHGAAECNIMNDENGDKTPVLLSTFGGLFIHISVQPVVARCAGGVSLVWAWCPTLLLQSHTNRRTLGQ